MNDFANKKLTANAKMLRRNMTKQERRLWYDFLKSLPVTVNRQKVLGEYIVDFYCAEAKLVIELDGSQHYTEFGQQTDLIRDKYLMDRVITVLRYSNLDIQSNFKGVCEDIYLHIMSAVDTSSDG